MSHWRDFLSPDGPDGAYLPWRKVEPRVGISRTTAWRLQRAGDFPKPYVVSPGRVAYRESEVEAWKASRGHRAAALSMPGVEGTRAAVTEAPALTPEPATWTPPAAPAPAGFRLAAPVSPAPIRAAAPRGPLRRRADRSGGDQITFDF